jgi:hypothetical protein
MLTALMRLADQWSRLEQDLPAGWREARLALATETPSDLPRAAAVLGPLTPGRRGDQLVFTIRRAGGPAGPEGARRLFRRLDRDRVWCEIELLEVVGEDAVTADDAVTAVQAPPPRTLASAWDDALAGLPEDWSDVLCSLELESSDYLPRAALLCAPLNPTRDRERLGFVFRVAREAGYGTSPGMTRRCLERCDEESIAGRVSILRVLADTDNVATQGVVWYVDGRVL